MPSRAKVRHGSGFKRAGSVTSETFFSCRGVDFTNQRRSDGTVLCASPVIAVMGGLAGATGLTLFVVPALVAREG